MTFALFEEHPSLERRIARVALGSFPSPVESLAQLSLELGASGEAWVKRDDSCSLVYGGNKVRTLELLFGEARALGHEAVLATGAFGSNHALASALHAPRVGLRPAALLFPQPVSKAAFTNLQALSWSGASLLSLPHWSALPLGMAWLGSGARAPYVMAPGGATPLGALGYVAAGLELGKQVAAGELPAPRRIIIGVGSTCSSAGLLVGLALAAHLRLGFRPDALPRLSSVRVSPWPVTSRFRVLRLAARASRLLHERSDGKLPLFEHARLAAELEVDGRYLGPGYGQPSAAGNEAEALWQRLGLPGLDGTYSAKAAARLIADLRANEAGPILFWSTKSSVPLPAAMGRASAQLPARMRAWLLRAERVLAASAR